MKLHSRRAYFVPLGYQLGQLKDWGWNPLQGHMYVCLEHKLEKLKQQVVGRTVKVSWASLHVHFYFSVAPVKALALALSFLQLISLAWQIQERQPLCMSAQGSHGTYYKREASRSYITFSDLVSEITQHQLHCNLRVEAIRKTC